jgi:hypothetical protein
MASLRLRSFTNVVSLKAIEPRRLLALLKPYAAYFEKRGFPLPQPRLLDTNYYERLIAILSNPTADTPPELLDALFVIDEMAHRDRIERLLESVTPEQLGFGPDDRRVLPSSRAPAREITDAPGQEAPRDRSEARPLVRAKALGERVAGADVPHGIGDPIPDPSWPTLPPRGEF